MKIETNRKKMKIVIGIIITVAGIFISTICYLKVYEDSKCKRVLPQGKNKK